MLDKNRDSKIHISILCKKAGLEFHTLKPILNYDNIKKLIKNYDECLYFFSVSYRPLVLMFYGRNKIHEKALRVA